MITITATGDTTLHTAGKYCEEDILVKVPVGGEGGGNELFKKIASVPVEGGDFISLTAEDFKDIIMIRLGFCYSHHLLEEVELSDDVEIILNEAFKSCRMLKKVTLGRNLTDIYSEAFSGCSNLTTIYCRCADPPLMDDGVLYHTPLEQIVVPIGSGNAYKNATNWSQWGDIIVEGNL